MEPGESEVTIICRAHRRRCYLKSASPGGPLRVWHEGVARGGDLCSSKRFLRRVGTEYTLQGLLGREQLE